MATPTPNDRTETSTCIDNDDDEKTPTDAYDLRLDKEIHVVRNLRATMISLLQVFESARDDLVVLGDKMDKVRVASERCRKELMKRQQSSASTPHSPPNVSGKRKREDEGARVIGKTRKTP